MAHFPENKIISLIGAPVVHDLGGSYGPNLRLGTLLDTSLQSSIAEMPIGYGTAEGNADLRRAIAGLHGVSADDVVVTVGGMHALFLIAFILCSRGDVAVTTAPAFPPARAVLDAVGTDVRVLPLSFDDGYRIDLAALAQLLSYTTKLVSLATPQNPSGVAIPQQTIHDVLILMQARSPDAYLLIDDTYREAAYGDDLVAASATALSPKVICVGSLSKCHGVPGLRLGWAVTRDPALRAQLVLGKFNTVISCSAVDEALALKVFEQSEQIIGERRTHLAECLAAMEEWVLSNQNFVEWIRPNAGALCCIRLRPSAFDDAAVERFYEILGGERIRVSNGAWFGDTARVLRLGFGHLAIVDLEAALNALGEALKEAAIRPLP